jgi:hypothetical protein
VTRVTQVLLTWKNSILPADVRRATIYDGLPHLLDPPLKRPENINGSGYNISQPVLI